MKEKSFLLAVVLNWFWPGLGYIYLERAMLGVCLGIFIPCIFLLLFILFPGALLLAVITQIVMGFDCYNITKKHNKNLFDSKHTECPTCLETVKIGALKCKHCGQGFV